MKYILDLLRETGLLGCKPTDSPIEACHKLDKGLKSPLVERKKKYQCLVGKLIYLSHAKLDITYIVSVVRQFMHNPNELQMKAVIWILKYLKLTLDSNILF